MQSQASGGDLNSGSDPVDSVTRSQELCDGKTNIDYSDAKSNLLLDMSSPLHNPLNRPLHYYVEVLNAEESTYEASERNMGIDPTFHA